MPFKSGKSFNDVNKKIENFADNVIPKRVMGNLYDLATTFGNYTDFLVPIDSGTLMDSRNQTVTQTGDLFKATIGYYGKQAGILHSPKPGGKMDGWKPKPVPSPGKKTGGFNADARQDWFNVTWAQYGNQLLSEFAEGITR